MNRPFNANFAPRSARPHGDAALLAVLPPNARREYTNAVPAAAELVDAWYNAQANASALAGSTGSFPSSHDRDALIATLASLLSLSSMGITRLYPDSALQELSHAVTAPGVGELRETQELIARGLELLKPGAEGASFVAAADAVAPLVGEDGTLAIRRFYVSERELAAALPQGKLNTQGEHSLDFLATSPSFASDGTTPVQLNTEQVAAVRSVLDHRLALVAGGPGTGKTTTVVAMLRALVRAGVRAEDIALAAPTGRAAFRMEESIRSQLTSLRAPDEADEALSEGLPQSKTLHRLLGYRPSTESFRYTLRNRLPQRVVVVDEASMIPLHLMRSLVEALADDARFVLIGDPDQLPPVEAGTPWADLVDGYRALDDGQLTELAESHRTSGTTGGASVYAASIAIRDAELEQLSETLHPRGSADDVTFEGAEHVADSSQLDELVLRVWRRTYRTPSLTTDNNDIQNTDVQGLFAAITRSRLLCLTHAGPAGTRAVNRAMWRELAKLHGADQSAHEYLPGEPVMMLRNDYARGIFNGDTGVVVKSDGAYRELVVVFSGEGGDARVVPLDDIRDSIASAWAVTVHKAQGSEFDEVIVALPDDVDLPLLSRNMLYTALTRARRGAVVVGSDAVLRAAVERTPARSSSLPLFLERRFG